MEHWLWILLAALLTECQGEDSVNQTATHLIVTEGNMVTISCTYETSASTPTLFWYKQDGNIRPTFILSQYSYGGGKTEEEFKERFSSKVDTNSKSVPLTILKLQSSDSAVYYCALRPATGNKFLFGSGTSLTITTSEEYSPSYYPLKKGDTEVCLATGFSRYDQHDNNTQFGSTKPARIDGDSLFNQVAFNSSCDAGLEGDGPGLCEDELRPDPTLNLVSVTVLGLRLILLKTIVFNVFLTFRLWLSR